MRSLRLCVLGGPPQERVRTGRASRTLPPAACPGFPAAPSPCACRPGPPAASLPANQRQQLCDAQGGRPHCVLCSLTLAPELTREPQAQERSFSLTVARRARLPYPIPGSATTQDACPPALSSGPAATWHEHQAKHAACPAGVAAMGHRWYHRRICSISFLVSHHGQFHQKPRKSSPENRRSVSESYSTSDLECLQCGPHDGTLSSVWQRARRQHPRETRLLSPSPPWGEANGEHAVQTHMVHHLLQALAEGAPSNAGEALLRLGEGDGPDARCHPELLHHGVGDARDLPQVVLSPWSVGSTKRFLSWLCHVRAQAEGPGDKCILSRLLKSLRTLTTWDAHVQLCTGPAVNGEPSVTGDE